MKIEDIEALTGVRVLPGSKPEQTSKIPAWLDEAFIADPELAEAWQGLGKRSGAVCDRIVVQRLISMRSDEEIVSALRWRPGRFFLPDHDANMNRELAEARKMIREERDRLAHLCDCVRLVVYGSDPPVYVATISTKGGQVEVRMDAGQLLNAVAFKRRVFEVAHMIVDVPGKRAEWEQRVRGWMASAEVVKIESPETQYRMDEIADCIRGWGVMDISEAHVEDLRRGVVVQDPERNLEWVHVTPIRDRLRGAGIDPDQQALARDLIHLGWSPGRVWLQGVQVRAWKRTPSLYRDTHTDNSNRDETVSGCPDLK